MSINDYKVLIDIYLSIYRLLEKPVNVVLSLYGLILERIFMVLSTITGFSIIDRFINGYS